MKYFMWFFMIILVFVVGCGEYQKKRTDRVMREFTISGWHDFLAITTSPEGARVYVNGEYKGLSPLKVTCPIDLVFNCGRWCSQETVNTYIHVRGVLVRSDVFLKDCGNLFASRFSRPGRIEVEVVKEGYKPIKKVIEINSGNDPQIQKYLAWANDYFKNNPGSNGIPEYRGDSPREISLLLEPLPGHYTYSEWQTGEKIGKEILSLAANVEIIPIDEKSARVSGKVLSATKKVLYAKTRIKTEPASGYREEEEGVLENVVRYVPSSLTLKNPFGVDVVFPVNEDGTFCGRLEIGSEVFFTGPKAVKYRRTEKLQDLVTTVWDTSSVTAEIPFPDVFRMAPDYAAAGEYVRKKICAVKIGFKDNDTRREVAPEFEIEVVAGLSFETFLSELSNELGGDEIGRMLVKSVLNDLEKQGFVPLGQGLGKKDQSVSFVCLRGAKLRVKTTHPDYYYFDKAFESGDVPSVDKEVLLIEKGTKIQMEQVGSERGTIIDKD